MGDQGHAGFDEHVGPGLKPPAARICCIGGPGDDALVWGEQSDDGLGLGEGLVEYLADVWAAAAGGLDKLSPLAWLKADGAEPVEQRFVGFLVMAVDDHDDFAVCREIGSGLSGLRAFG